MTPALSAVCEMRVSVYATHHYGLVENHDAAEQLWTAIPFPPVSEPADAYTASLTEVEQLSLSVNSMPAAVLMTRADHRHRERRE